MMHWFQPFTLLLGLSLCFAAKQSTPAEDPELSEQGRSTYLGRPIAQTMHWSGAEWLMRETREKEENSSKLIAKLGLDKGDSACDLGCGNGYFTLPMARLVGEQGKVFAVDIQPEMLTLLEQQLATTELNNVQKVLGTLSDPKLAPQSCDLILMVDVYHELSHPVTVLAHLRKALKPGGELVLVEFRLEDAEVPIKLRHKMSKAQMIAEMSANGLEFSREFNGLPWQHMMAFGKDSSYPRETHQARSEGKAIARGFARAWKQGDFLSLSGFCEDSILSIPLGAESEASKLAVHKWLAGLHTEEDLAPWVDRYRDWKVTVEPATPSNWRATREGDLCLSLSSGKTPMQFFLRRDPRGPWRVIAQRSAR